METIEQKKRRLLLDRIIEARNNYTLEEIGEAYGCGKWNIGIIEDKLRHGGGLFQRTIDKLNKALDTLDVPKQGG